MHDHAPAPGGIRSASSRRLLAISLSLTATVMLVQIVGALLSGSLALLADAAHMFTDASGLVIALIAATVAARPADDRRTFGYQRAEVFGALYLQVLQAQRAALIAERDEGQIEDEAARAMLDRLDLQEAGVSARLESRF